MEEKVSVALLVSRDDNCLGGGSEDETIADSREGESERKWRGVCVVSGIMFRLRVRRKLSEVCSSAVFDTSIQRCIVTEI